MNSFCRLQSPVGELLLTAEDDALTGLYFGSPSKSPALGAGWREDAEHAVLRESISQLQQYFGGTRQTFCLPLRGRGTDFQQRVWRALGEIPYGQTWSYGELARHIGQHTASRAVGLANGRNPLAVIVPCHRVIGADGSLTGFGGGLPRKQWLLAHESAQRRIPAVA